MAQIKQSLVGHEQVWQRLQAARARSRVPSTLIFAGPAGVGKKRWAWAWAQTLLCEAGQVEACGECGSCLRVERQQNENILWVEPQSQVTTSQIKVEQAQDVLRFLNLQKLGRARVVMIEEAHLLNPQAANSLLKVIEEPPVGTYFILLTSNGRGLLPTLRSRGQLLGFRPLTLDNMQTLFPQAPAWALSLAQGRADVVQQILSSDEEAQELRELAAQAIVQDFSDATLSEVKERAKDRAAALQVLQTWQQIVREALYQGAGRERPHFADLAVRKVAALPVAWQTRLAELSLQYEHDILSNVDRGLIFDNWAQTWPRI